MDAAKPAMSLRVLEIAMEIALPPPLLESVFQRFGYRPTREVAMSTSVGGIGPLLRERIVGQADQGVDVIGVSLLYETTWIQSWFDWGQLHLEKREVATYLKEFLVDTGIVLELPMFDGTPARVQVWQATYGKARVYFLEAAGITQVVYPSEEDAPPKKTNATAWAEELRFKQSWLVGRGALAVAKALNFTPDVTALSETPTFFGHHRLALDAFHDDLFFSKTRYIFNDHTPMEYAHPIWSAQTIQTLKVDTSAYPVPANASAKGDIDVTRLLIAQCEGVFGVSAKHGRVMREMPSLRDLAPKIGAITNGVYLPYWQAPEFADVAAMNDEELLQARRQKKAELLDWVWRHYGLWHTWKEQIQGKAVVLWTRRITGYKRMDLLLALCRDGSFKKQFLDTNVVLLIGGRIHQHDDQAQAMIYNLLDLIAVDPLLQERIVFLDNFNIWMAPRLFQGADAAIMLADDGREASATGFMKAQMNGDLIIATDDGAIPESVIFSKRGNQVQNGFEVPYVNGHPTAEGLLRALKSLQQVLKKPEEQIAMVRSAFAATPQVSVERTVVETIAFYKRLLSPNEAPADASLK